MDKKILYIDMDGVCANFNKFMEKLLPDVDLGEGISEEDYERRSALVDEAALKYPTLFEELECIDGAIDTITKLKEKFEIYFLSSPMSKVPESYMGKRRWIKKHFGDWADKRLILTHRKDLCIGHYLIDDRLKNGAKEFPGVLIFFGGEAFPNWKEVYEYLKER